MQFGLNFYFLSIFNMIVKKRIIILPLIIHLLY